MRTLQQPRQLTPAEQRKSQRLQASCCSLVPDDALPQLLTHKLRQALTSPRQAPALGMHPPKQLRSPPMAGVWQKRLTAAAAVAVTLPDTSGYAGKTQHAAMRHDA